MWLGIEGRPGALLSFVSCDGVFRWRRSTLHLFRRRFLLRDWGCAAPRFRGGLRLAPVARLAIGRRFAAGRLFALVRRFPVVRRFAVVRRFTGRRFFRDEREVAARFLRFAICCLLLGQGGLRAARESSKLPCWRHDINGQTGSALLGQVFSWVRLYGVGIAMTWEAIFEQWPSFAAAAGVLVVVIGLLILLKLKSKHRPNTTGSAADSKEWVLTGQIDFVDPHSAGELVLQVEETRIVNSPSGIEHREIRWRRATLDEGKVVLVSYHAQRNLLMSANFIVSAPTRTKQSANTQAEMLRAEANDAANGEDIVDVKPIAPEVSS